MLTGRELFFTRCVTTVHVWPQYFSVCFSPIMLALFTPLRALLGWQELFGFP
jgi:hypothetical protein